MCNPISSIFSFFFVFFFKKINHWYRFQFFREMRQKSKKVGRWNRNGNNSEAKGALPAKLLFGQKWPKIGHNKKNIYIYIYILVIILNKTEKSIFCRGIIEELFSKASGSP